MSRHTADSWWYRKTKAVFLADNPICWDCTHPASDEIDHVVPVSVAPELKFDPANWRPSHGHRGCPTCRRKCNQQRGTGPPPKRTTSRAW